MNRIAGLCLVCFVSAFALSQASVPPQPTDAQIADLITKVQNMPASKLDRKLPAIRLADWLQGQGGPDAKLVWVFRHDPSTGTRDAHGLQDCVEADATLSDGRTFFVMIDVGTDPHRPRVRDVSVMAARDLIEESLRLSDLPRVLKTSQTSRFEAQR